jgi:hypothetical protein
MAGVKFNEYGKDETFSDHHLLYIYYGNCEGRQSLEERLRDTRVIYSRDEDKARISLILNAHWLRLSRIT